MSNAAKYATGHALVSAFIYDHAEFLDSNDYDAQRDRENGSYETTTYLDFKVSSWDPWKFTVTCHGPNARLLMRRVCREFGGRWDKDASSDTFYMTRETPEGLTLRVEASRKLVCTPQVIGTKEVEVPDYSNLPKKKVTQEIIEWHCPPSLLEVTSQVDPDYPDGVYEQEGYDGE